MIKALITEMYLMCAPSQIPEGSGLDALARTWARGLSPVPDQHLRAVYERALAQHSRDEQGRRFPLSGSEFLGAWLDFEAEHAAIAHRGTIHLAPGNHRLPAPPPPQRATVASATHLLPLLMALNEELGMQLPGRLIVPLYQALIKHDPAADVATWRARLQAARAADSAPTVASLVAALLPTPEATDAL